MKKVLVHVGYPKAASTTLQNGLFLELHKKNAINFLGRAFESGFYGAKSNKSEYKKWFNRVLDNKDCDGPNAIGKLAEASVNLLSEGWFITHERFNDRIVSPEILQKHFSRDADQIEVLIIIRKQEDLIPSYYIQNYRRLEQTKFAEYLAYNVKHKWTGEAKIFNFRDMVRAYADVFGRNKVHIVLFEDLVGNKDRLSAELGKALNVDAAIIKASLGERQLNQTRNEAGTVVVRKFDKKSLRYRLFQKLEKVSLSLGDFLRIRVPTASGEEKRTIHQFFKASNLELAEEFSLDKNVMREYGYI